MKQCLAVIAIGISIFSSAVGFADCVDGVRKGTPAEEAFFQKAQAALKEVLPTAPAGWTFTPMRDGTLGSLCTGTQEGAFSITVAATYTYRPPKDEADRMNAESRKIQAEIDTLEKLSPELTKERNDLMAKYSEKTRAARQAEKEGNKKLAHSLYEEREAFGRQSNAVRDKHLASVKPKTDELRKKQQGLFSGPQEIAETVSANEQYPEKITPGYQSEITVGKVPAPRSPGLKVHGVRTVAKGPAPKREEILSLVDKAKMERLLR
jgi:hypothetical protein